MKLHVYGSDTKLTLAITENREWWGSSEWKLYIYIYIYINFRFCF